MTKEEQRIEEVLAKIRMCVDKQRVQPGPKERRKNEEFLRNYCVKPPERYAILKELTVQNYCGEILERQKTEVNYDEILYVFGIEKKLKLKLESGEKSVEIYIKVQFFKLNNDDNDYTLLVSFHEAEHPLKYMFKK